MDLTRSNNVGKHPLSTLIMWIVAIIALIIILLVSPSKKKKLKRRWNRYEHIKRSDLMIEDITNTIPKLLKTKPKV